jgi:glycosyltransferase involved in cell wall biosynthesis
MMRRKVLILPSWYPSRIHPVNGIFVQDQAREISKKYEAAVLYPRWAGYRDMLAYRLGPRSENEEEAGLMVCRERALVPLPRQFKLGYHFYFRAAKRGFEKLLSTWGKPDVIHAHVVLPAGWAASILGRQHRIPVVLTEHSGPFSMHLRSKGQKHLVRETLNHVDRVIAVSPTLEREIQTFHKGPGIRVVGNVIRTEFFFPSNGGPERPGPRGLRFFSAALLSEKKGMRYLIEAMHLLAQRGVTSFELIIGGDGPARHELEEMVKSLGVADRCRFLGMLTPLEVRNWIQQSDVFVLPSLGETFGIVLGEAMACGKPVIATRCGGPEFVVTEETGLLVDVANASALADAMHQFVTERVTFDPDLIRKSVVERFGEETFLRTISEVYEEVWRQGGA